VTVSTTFPAQAPPKDGVRSPAAQDGSKRLTIAVLIDNANFLEGCYEANFREALDAKCRQDGHNLLLLYGGSLDALSPVSAADNAIFRALRPSSFDGIVVVSSMLAAFCGPEPVARLLESYRPASLCSVGLAMPGVPSLVVDNRGGMEAVVEHLVREHGVRRPVFLAGTPQNPEAQARFEAYRDVLARHGIPFDPALVACGYFMPKQGRSAMDSLLAAGVAFDGVVAANDNMAMGAIEALRKWGRRVPRDIPVTGFDDVPLAGSGSPPLTTVAQPFERMANLAIETVVAQLAGRQVPDCVELPSQFVCRRSCGCEFERYPSRVGSPPASPAAHHRGRAWEPFQGSHIRTAPDVVRSEAPPLHQDRIAALGSRLERALCAHPEDAALVSHRLVESLRSGSGGPYRAFPKAVGDLIDDIGDDSEHHRLLQDAIGWLRDELSDLSDMELERAFYEGMNLVATSSTTTRTRQRLILEDSYATLLKLSEQASVAFDLSSLEETLVKGLPAAGIRTAFLSCALDANATDLVPVVCLVDGQAVKMPEPSFPASRLLPPSALVLERRRTLLVFPTAFESQLLGVAAFDYADGVRTYAVFRNEITAVVKSIRLHQELVQKTMLHERSVQERLATTKRMEALSVLAGGVAHDLNNVLGPLVALPDLILEDLDKLKTGDNAVADLRADIEVIKTASLRAAQTIKDLLTLGRQGRTVKESIDLSRVVRSCLAESRLLSASDKSRPINVVVDTCAEPLAVRGSESQLARAVDNLVRNAIEAIDGHGEIVVKICRENLALPGGRYETIPAGSYAVLTVSDNGCGIESLDLARVFEPFFTKKRVGESSGTGLGLAIVHGVVKEHDGFIDVTSVPGTGTTFSLYLPLVHVVLQVRERPAVTPHRQAKILVVDDETIQLRTCRRVLVHLGYEVDTMQSGLCACEVFGQAAEAGKSPYDLVILDMVLNEILDGLQVFELIQRLFPAQKAIVASGHAPNERAELAVNRGLIWLAKPYTVEALTQVVERVLEGSVNGEERRPRGSG
jgi:signal transduction histidine kinase/DNA-binding LacI/PurR family transcriptional regulator/ActR/RegA family two-component response regulator